METFAEMPETVVVNLSREEVRGTEQRVVHLTNVSDEEKAALSTAWGSHYTQKP